jgi:hypothetical protein
MGGLDLRVREMKRPRAGRTTAASRTRRASVSGPIPSAMKSFRRSIPRDFRRSRARTRWAVVDVIDSDVSSTIPRLIEESGKSLRFGARLDSDGRMIRGGFLSEEDRKALIALARDWRPVA